jgi:NAD(P)-dependent dehydrogenase (short-subunit alcohol dehydrogenase family)
MATATVLVTGASSGIGYSIAAELPRHGHHVIAAMRSPEARNAAAAAALRTLAEGSPGRCDVVEIDVTRDASVAAGIARAVSLSARLDVLVNCAGIMWLGVTEAFSVAQLEAVMQTNLYGPFRMLRAVLPVMRAQRSGLAISISSIAGRLVTPGAGIYSASKFALEALTESMRYEAASLGIELILVEPGPFRTNLKANAVPPEDATVAKAYGPLGELQRSVPERMAVLLEDPAVSTDPKAVADAVRALIALPAGKRPIRTTVGLDLGVAELNRAAAPFQSGYLEAMGLEGTAVLAQRGWTPAVP